MISSVALLLLSLVACDADPVETAGETGSMDTDTGGMDTDTGGMDTDTGGGDTDTAAASLYEQIGGAAAVDAVVEQFVANVAADPNINWFFAHADIPILKAQLKDQICAATGGPCTYSGGDMVTVHAGMAITDAQFDFLVADLLMALDTLGVPYALDGSATIDPLLFALVGMRGDIVTDPQGTVVYFNQLGGHGAVEVVIDTFLTNVLADPEINGRFATTDAAALRSHLIDQVCSATGGYCTYTGRTMLETHQGMNITEAEFNFLVGDLLKALDTLGVPYSATLDGTGLADALLLALLGMKGDIVGH